LFESDGKKKVYRKIREAFKIQNLISTVKYSEKSFFWRFMAASGIGLGKLEFIHDGKMNQHMYV